MKLALVQLVSTASVDANLARTRALLEQAAQQGVELAVLPEYFCLLGHGDEAKLRIRETPGQGPIQDFLSRTARELGLWIVGGTLPIDAGAAVDEDRRAYNSTRVYSPR